MKQTCPKCEDQALATVARGVSKCPECGGSFVAPGATPQLGEPLPAQAAENDAQGGACPTDGTIMSRAEVDLGGEQLPVHLERCSTCRSVWFDAGEWATLAERELIDHLDDFWTVEWRTSQRRMRNEREYDRRLREEFGPELYDALCAMATRLRGYERRSQALAFLREASSE